MSTLSGNNPPTLEEALALFNARAFFECHEVLEDLWRPLAPGPEKTFLQGLLQVGVGFHHLQNGNYIGTRNLLASGLEKLEAVHGQRFYQAPILLPPLITAVREALTTVRELGPAGLAQFPDTLIPQTKRAF